MLLAPVPLTASPPTARWARSRSSTSSVTWRRTSSSASPSVEPASSPLGRVVPCVDQSDHPRCVSHAPARAAVPGHCPVVRWIRTSRARRLAEPF